MCFSEIRVTPTRKRASAWKQLAADLARFIASGLDQRAAGGPRITHLRNRQSQGSKLKNRRLPVKFKVPRNVIVFRTADLDRPFITYNAELLAIFGPQLERELAERTRR
jgi:hypothetical protein